MALFRGMWVQSSGRRNDLLLMNGSLVGFHGMLRGRMRCFLGFLVCTVRLEVVYAADDTISKVLRRMM